jgi:hypothetical protein
MLILVVIVCVDPLPTLEYVGEEVEQHDAMMASQEPQLPDDLEAQLCSSRQATSGASRHAGESQDDPVDPHVAFRETRSGELLELHAERQ